MAVKLSQTTFPGGTKHRNAIPSEIRRISIARAQYDARKQMHDVYGSFVPAISITHNRSPKFLRTTRKLNPIHYLTLRDGLLNNFVFQNYEAIVQQTHCGVGEPKGLAANIASTLPYGCPYKYRQTFCTE
jgi:hypothetical protein